MAGMIGGRREQAGVVGIAAHDAVEGHHVGEREGGGYFPKVGIPESHALTVAQALCFLVRDREVRRGRVYVRCLAKAPVEQCVMDRAYAPSDVEDSRVGWQRRLTNRGQELSGTRIGPAPTKSPRLAPRSSAVEFRIVGTAMTGSHARRERPVSTC
jgi:hypothetical protein